MDRIKILKDAIVDMSYNRWNAGICATIANSAYRDVFKWRKAFVLFPEFEKYRPKKEYTIFGWFPYDEDGTASRIAIMLLVLDEICRAEKRN